MKKKNTEETCSIAPDGFERLCSRYAEHLTARNYSAKSVDTYLRALKDLARFLMAAAITRPGDITAGHLEAYHRALLDRGFQANSRQVYIRAVCNVFRWLEARREIFVNPAVGLRVRMVRNVLQPVAAPAQIDALFNAPDTSRPVGLRDRAFLETMYATGARRGELTAALLAGVDGSGGTLRLLGKGARERVVPLTGSAMFWLGRYIREGRQRFAGQESGRLWLGQSGPITPACVTMIFRVHSDRAGLMPRVGPHMLRRACATQMLRNGAEPVAIQQLLGHATLKHLSQYLAVTICELKRCHHDSNLGA